MAEADGAEAAVLVERRGAVAILRLNRPKQLNAVDFVLMEELAAALAAVGADDAVRAVVLVGNGRSFCAGGDLGVFHRDLAAAPKTAAALIDLFHAILRAIARMPKPVIAAAHGPVAGGGFSLAMGCDMVVADEGTTFLSAYTKLGTTPDGGLTFTLTRLIGPRRALDVILANPRIDAQTALTWGLVNRVAPAGEAERLALDLAEGLAGASRGAVAAVKRLLTGAEQVFFDAQLDAEQAAFAQRAATADFREGIAAFVERRPPHFPD